VQRTMAARRTLLALQLHLPRPSDNTQTETRSSLAVLSLPLCVHIRAHLCTPTYYDDSCSYALQVCLVRAMTSPFFPCSYLSTLRSL